MGFFRDLASSVVNFVGNGIGIAVEQIGNALSWDALTYAGLNLQVACNFGEHHWNSESTPDDTAEVHSLLDLLKQQIVPQAQSKEELLIEQCVDKITDLLVLFKNIFTDQKISRLEREYRNEITLKLSGSIMRYIEPKLSFDNKRCRDILNEPDGVRQRSASEYQDQLLQKAEAAFLAECEKVFREHVEKIRNDVQTQLRTLQQDYNEKMSMVTRLLEENPDETQIDLERSSLSILKMNLEMLYDLASL